MAKNNSWIIPSFDSDFTATTKSHAVKQSSIDIPCNDLLDVPSNRNSLCKSNSNHKLSVLLSACEPKELSELLIYKPKQELLASWLRCKAKKGHPAVLILSGPSGCGKTAAIRVVAKTCGFQIVEWIAPLDRPLDEYNGAMRQGDSFEDFMIRTTRYNSVLSDYSRRLLLVKELPNIYLMDKDSFHTLLTKYFEVGREPIIFVCTESGNSRVLQTLFTPELRERFGIEHISINSISQTAMKKGLKRVADILNSKASELLCVTQRQIDEVLSNNIGDIRSAVLNLIFISLKVPKKEGVKECGSREETLGLLHAVGRVINPKRVPITTSAGSTWKFTHDPDEIAAFFHAEPTVSLCFIQENYLNTMSKIEEASMAADILSLGDVLNSEWRDLNISKAALSICVRGVMVANEKPVSGWNPVRKYPYVDWKRKRDITFVEFPILKPK